MIDGISVVVCCFNSEKRISKVLSHLLQQQNGNTFGWEVIIVDNASTDQTKSVARSSWDHPSVELKIVDEPNPGLSHARRKGLDVSKFNIISFIDDDNWVEDHWVEKVYHYMSQDPDIGILGGRGIATFETDPPEWFIHFQDSYAVGPQAKASGKVQKILYGAGLSIRKEAWNHLVDNGFEFILSDRKGSSLNSGGDSELCLAVLLSGYHTYYVDDLTFYHFMPAVRIQWKYLVDLEKAFGRAAPVANIYFSFLREKGWGKLKYENPFFALLNSLYNLLKILPEFVPIIFRKKEGEKSYLMIHYHSQSLLGSVRLFWKIRGMVRKIREGQWRINPHRHV
jgi:glycosyltransferase involved in cell wall biosynthesis